MIAPRCFVARCAVILSLDVNLLRGLYDEVGRACDAEAERAEAPALASVTADAG